MKLADEYVAMADDAMATAIEHLGQQRPIAAEVAALRYLVAEVAADLIGRLDQGFDISLDPYPDDLADASYTGQIKFTPQQEPTNDNSGTTQQDRTPDSVCPGIADPLERD